MALLTLEVRLFGGPESADYAVRERLLALGWERSSS